MITPYFFKLKRKKYILPIVRRPTLDPFHIMAKTRLWVSSFKLKSSILKENIFLAKNGGITSSTRPQYTLIICEEEKVKHVLFFPLHKFLTSQNNLSNQEPNQLSLIYALFHQRTDFFLFLFCFCFYLETCP